MSVIPDVLYHMGGAPVGIPEVGPRTHINTQKVVYFVDANNGSSRGPGETWASAYSTIQAAVTAANSAKHATDNVDIYIANGLYEETVEITRAGTGLGSDTMLWANGGQNIGTIGRLRLIGTGGFGTGGGVFLYGGTSATYPTISVGRPNVEIHNFATIKAGTSTAAGSWYDSDGISGSDHIEMPVIAFVDNYNASALLGGAANNCVLKNCRINGGGVSGGIANVGANWIFMDNLVVEYCDDYGIATVGSAKGSPCENRTSRILFHQNTDTDLLHGNNIIHWVHDCKFASATVTKNLIRTGSGGGASAYCWIDNCFVLDEADLVDASNAGWDATRIWTATETGPVQSTDLTGANWVVTVSD